MPYCPRLRAKVQLRLKRILCLINVRNIDKMKAKRVFLLRTVAGFTWVEHKAFLLSGVAIAAVAIIVSVSAIARYGFGVSFGWVFETTQYLLVWFTLLPAAWLVCVDKHIKVDVVTIHLPPQYRRILEVIYYAVGLIVSVCLAVFGVIVVVDLYAKGSHETTLTEPLSWPLYLIIPVGFILLTLEFVKQLVRAFAAERRG